MIGRTVRAAACLGLCAALILGRSGVAAATPVEMEDVGVRISSYLSVRIDRPEVPVYRSADDGSAIVGYAVQGKSYDVINSAKGGWVWIQAGEDYGYVRAAGNATLIERTWEKVDESLDVRQKVVDLALQFLGNPYVYGGTDPNRGIDCSAFVQYIMETAAGVRLGRTTADQSRQGVVIDLTQIRQGDLIFYGDGDDINHVAIYIGNGQVVHASTEKTGIITSYWLYRDPVKVCRVIPD